MPPPSASPAPAPDDFEDVVDETWPPPSAAPSPPPPAAEPSVTVVETTVTLTATEDGTLDDAAAVAALAEELGVDAERITLVPSFDGTLEEGATMKVKVVVEVAPEDATTAEAVEEKLNALDDGEKTDAFGESFEVTAVAAVVVTRPAPSPPPAESCDCNDDNASDDCKAACDAIGGALLFAGTALILVIALPVGGCVLLTLCIVLIVCCCCRNKEKPHQHAVDVPTPSAAGTSNFAPQNLAPQNLKDVDFI